MTASDEVSQTGEPWLATSQLTGRLEEADGALVVALAGQLDAALATELCARLDVEDRWGEEVVLDLSQLSFCDSSGLRAFINCDRWAQSAGGRLVLREPSETCRRILHLSGLDEMLNIEP